MAETALWVIRAGRGAEYVDLFREKSLVSMSFPVEGPIQAGATRDSLRQLFEREAPGEKPGSILVWASQAYRFLKEVAQGDGVVTYDPNLRAPEQEAQKGPDEEALRLVRDETIAKSDGFIEDRIARLGWAEMQELVAGLLRAMRYKTVVSPPGADRGFDVFASPDGLGLEDPRIFVEVKHRTTSRRPRPECARTVTDRSVLRKQVQAINSERKGTQGNA